MNHFATVFKLNREGFSLQRGIALAAILLGPLVVLALLNQSQYWLSVTFGALFVGLSDPGGNYAVRVQRMAVVGAIGALLTLLAFVIGRSAWGWVVLAAFAVTFVSGLGVKYGKQAFTAVVLLNGWFVLALMLPSSYEIGHIHTHAWSQTLAWIIGSALTIAYTCIMWLARGRTAQPRPFADVLPGDTSPVELTRPVVFFAAIRAIAIAITFAIAFGLSLPNADWMPIATMVAMRPSLQQSTLVAEQRLLGAIIGAAVAALFLLTVRDKIALEVVMLVLAVLAGSVRAVNYALYTATVAAAVLIALDLSDPTNLAAEGRRIFFTFAGVAIALVVLVIGGLLAKRAQHAVQPAPAG